MTRHITLTTIAILVAAAAWAQQPQQPKISEAKLTTREAAAKLAAEFDAIVKAEAGPAFIGWAAPALPGKQEMCCCSNLAGATGSCSLESNQYYSNRSKDDTSTAPAQFLILARIENSKVTRLRTYTPDCNLTAGGRPVYWLTGVQPAESVALLSRYAADDHGALSAIAIHNDPAADRALEGFVGANQPAKLRERAVFWLGAARGRRGFEVLNKLVREDRDESVRDRAVFAVSVSKEPQAVETLLHLARNDASPKIRGRALFWLGQKAGNKVADTLADAAANDPDEKVKREAVFALSRLPKDEGVPLLINLARSNRSPAVRKHAMFWLGRSGDPRALSFFEEVLRK